MLHWIKPHTQIGNIVSCWIKRLYVSLYTLKCTIEFEVWSYDAESSITIYIENKMQFESIMLRSKYITIHLQEQQKQLRSYNPENKKIICWKIKSSSKHMCMSNDFFNITFIFVHSGGPSPPSSCSFLPQHLRSLW